jgi:hypothetical protein
MSEAQNQIEPTETNVQPDLAAEIEAVQTEQADSPHSVKTSRPLTLPDWTPLGSIRDYFAEQIRQDGFR